MIMGFTLALKSTLYHFKGVTFTDLLLSPNLHHELLGEPSRGTAQTRLKVKLACDET